MAILKDAFSIGARCVVAQDADLRGPITLGTGCVVHPKCTVIAASAPIVFGQGCIVEEYAIIVNRNKETMVIGDDNLFEVASRVEAARIGSRNAFEPRARVAHTVSIGDECVVGAGVTLIADPFAGFDDAEEEEEAQDGAASRGQKASDEASAPIEQPASETTKPTATAAPSEVAASESVPDRTVVYGYDAARREHPRDAIKAAHALHLKHLDYLRDTLPKSVKLRLFT